MKVLVPVHALSQELGARLALFERVYGSEIAVQVVDGVCDGGPTSTAHAAEAFYIGDISEEDAPQAKQAKLFPTELTAPQFDPADKMVAWVTKPWKAVEKRNVVELESTVPETRQQYVQVPVGILEERESLRIDRVQLGKDIEKWKMQDLKAVKLEAQKRAAVIQARVASRGAVVGLPSKVHEEQVPDAPLGYWSEAPREQIARTREAAAAVAAAVLKAKRAAKATNELQESEQVVEKPSGQSLAHRARWESIRWDLMEIECGPGIEDKKKEPGVLLAHAEPGEFGPATPAACAGDACGRGHSEKDEYLVDKAFAAWSRSFKIKEAMEANLEYAVATQNAYEAFAGDGDGGHEEPERQGAAGSPRPHRGSGGSYDVAVIGGGVVGSSVALHLAALGGRGARVVVLEPDACYRWASAPRSAGGIRQQFSQPVNIQLSMYGVQFLKETVHELCAGSGTETDVQFRENGYLILASPGNGESVLRENVAVQHAAGADWISLLDAAQLAERFPWLSVDGVAAGAFGERNEGYFDPWALLQAMRQGSQARGVTYVEQAVSGLRLSPDGRVDSLALADGSVIHAGAVVNAAGAHGGRVVEMCGPWAAKLPVEPRKRCMWAFRCAGGTASAPAPDAAPLTVDPGGVYFRSEGSQGRFLCGVSPRPEDDRDCSVEDLEHADHELFDEVVWPALASRVPAFEALRVESSWAGFYEYNTFDQNAVVGWHPDVSNMLIACGFSGHGLQHAPGAGRACAELLVHGEFRTLDLSCLGFGRLLRSEPLLERGIY
ncbi:unnamed protein product [Prorocentrum cordatum]|uniref:FAD-dependent oxidoreductase domain-containing protein 1 n=1 Tax=Prorocentrum cordatum TaxID=2364126 RepID=A0ABN9THR1_9DINO|nr:unnamed protein product [Polarella glacialis]